MQQTIKTKLQGRSLLKWSIIALAAISILALVGFFADLPDFAKTLVSGSSGSRSSSTTALHVQLASGSNGSNILTLPNILFSKGIYQNDSFMNKQGIVPAFWQGDRKPLGNNNSNNNQTDDNDKRHHHNYGPCHSYDHPIDWEAEIDLFNRTGEAQYNEGRIVRSQAADLQGYCRPGFIIIGAGKCGTSSLYHYIASHPRVLPASEKQIHYFKYHRHEPLKWYYSHFPKTSNFLAAGALMSGEASPGYLPYPDVVIDMKNRMRTPRILAIGRNPIERAFSSYKYNYVTPTIKFLSTGKQDGISRNQPDDFYTQFLYSFEDMLRAELQQLRKCFAPGSEAELATRKRWGKVTWIKEEYARRNATGLPPLIDLDGFCYGSHVNDTVLRPQWTDLVTAQPEKVILDRNLHLTQAFIGRSLYLFPLEWWYTAFDKEHVYFVCTEELEDFSGESMNSVGEFLGLPRYANFSDVVQGGAFNVGGHRGYDKEISWDKIGNEHKKDTEIPLSPEFRKELEEFIRPYNERLFEISGRRCNW